MNRREHYGEYGAPVTLPKIWQVMVAPVLVLVYAILYATESWDIMLGLNVLLALGGVLYGLVRNETDDRGGWDDVNLP